MMGKRALLVLLSPLAFAVFTVLLLISIPVGIVRWIITGKPGDPLAEEAVDWCIRKIGKL